MSFQGDGLFAVKNIKANTIIAQYGGYRMDITQDLPSEMYTNGEYRLLIDFIDLGQ